MMYSDTQLRCNFSVFFIIQDRLASLPTPVETEKKKEPVVVHETNEWGENT